MITMRFHWWNEENDKEGTVKISTPTLKDCIELAEENIEDAGLTITDYYVIEEED